MSGNGEVHHQVLEVVQWRDGAAVGIEGTAVRHHEELIRAGAVRARESQAYVHVDRIVDAHETR
jgi:hypothetical protein